MNRYYLEVRYQVTPVEAVDEHTDAMVDALSVEPNPLILTSMPTCVVAG